MNEFVSIVGGNGFLGKKIASLFTAKKLDYKVFDINFSKKSLNYVNVENTESLEVLKNSSAIINLAAVHRDDVMPITRYDDVNIGGAINVCNFASENSIKKIIFTSSVAIYGDAEKDTDENGEPNYFNDYGRTKYEAEQVYKSWQKEKPDERTLVIIRPTVIFGEDNRGNVYNLLNQIYRKRFLMIGNGKNIKSMAYVDNVAAFVDFCMEKSSGIHIYNYIDKPDLNMNDLVKLVKKTLFKKDNIGYRLPVGVGLFIGYLADLFSSIFKVSFPISAIRVKKFISDSMFSSKVSETNFVPPFKLIDALIKTIKHEFEDVNENENNKKYFSE